ncbi:MAG TPA: ABC transporter permease [Pseudolabrys sp.]|jgi:NitT/TauT family transport system permease protein|nr:ABC transporter permease [Pseudolabrys sp.]
MAMVATDRIAAARRPPTARQRAFRRAFISILLGIVAWELIGRFVLTSNILFAPFSEVMIALWRSVETGELWLNLWVSSVEFLIGFGAAIVVGVAVGVLMGRFKVVFDYLDPWVSILYSSPLVALMPFYLLLFGVGLLSKVAIVYTVSIFPILLNTCAGIRSTDRNLLEVARSFSCSEMQTFTKIQIPSALPFIITGVRLGLGRALTGVVVGELFASQAGVGYLIATAGQSFDAANVLMGVLIFTLAGLALMTLLNWAGGYFAPWRASMDNDR